ncbi:AMP-binding protein [Nocardiopsis sediminis]|uniref:AMP-binding protein n=1 Tax=Nocardiopsis sediminis TaxID=1778267 RepID=A0ABV8FU94_9ACTN
MSNSTGDNRAARSGLIHEILDGAAAAAPGATAVRDPHGPWDYARVAALSHAFARWLSEMNVGRGDRILVLASSRREIVPVLYGASRVGAVLVPLDPGLKEFQLRSIIADCRPSLAIGESEGLQAAAAEARVPTHALDKLWEAVEFFLGDTAGPPEVTPADLAIMIYTSGSTAAPKGVMCPHASVVFAASAINEVLGYSSDDVVLCRLPLAFDYGLYQVLLAGLGHAEIILSGMESDLLLMRRMREQNVTVVPVVPSLGTMLTTLARRSPDATASVRMITNTGAALSASSIDELRGAFPNARVVRMYGITECKRVTIMPPDEEFAHPDSVGRPLPGTRVLILDDEGVPLPPHKSGEIAVVGRNVMAGYWRAPEQTERVYRRNASTGEVWMRTGDYGSLDDDGYLYFEGRRDDMFKRKGTRMSTVEIEAAALDIPGVRAAAVVPPGPGHDLALFVESERSPQEVLREMARRLEPAKVPGICKTVERMPLTRNGKNARGPLAQMLEGGAS